MGMEGNLQSITQGPISALHTNGSTMAGMGLTMEGMELGNELVYDVLLDQAWSPVPINFTEYAKNWATRRYMIQQLPPDAAEAWDILATTVYNNSDPDSQAAIKSIFELSPATTGLINVTGMHDLLTLHFFVEFIDFFYRSPPDEAPLRNKHYCAQGSEPSRQHLPIQPLADDCP